MIDQIIVETYKSSWILQHDCDSKSSNAEFCQIKHKTALHDFQELYTIIIHVLSESTGSLVRHGNLYTDTVYYSEVFCCIKLLCGLSLIQPINYENCIMVSEVLVFLQWI